MFRGVLVTFPPEYLGGKIIPVNIEGIPEKYGRFEVDDSYRSHDIIEHFKHEMRRQFERRIPIPNLTEFLPDKTPAIKKVIFNDPATIVIWKDDTKTVVKCQSGDTYSEELGLAMCISKKYLGNKGNFNDEFKKWLPEETNDPYVGDCESCKYVDKGLYDKPCIDCNHNNGNKNNYRKG